MERESERKKGRDRGVGGGVELVQWGPLEFRSLTHN